MLGCNHQEDYSLATKSLLSFRGKVVLIAVFQTSTLNDDNDTSNQPESVQNAYTLFRSSHIHFRNIGESSKEMEDTASSS